jgi:hypothetical protein
MNAAGSILCEGHGKLAPLGAADDSDLAMGRMGGGEV